jgi:hypothetical protein
MGPFTKLRGKPPKKNGSSNTCVSCDNEITEYYIRENKEGGKKKKTAVSKECPICGYDYTNHKR